MSTSVNRLPWAEAMVLAVAAKHVLAGECERIEIAGSLRRARPDVGDIEIVCIPRRTPVVVNDLFGARETQIESAVDLAVDHLLGTYPEWQARRNKDGHRSIGSAMKLLTYHGFGLDIFTATRETWGVTYTIRTGSADFSHRLVTPTSQGGLCPPHLHFKGWQVRHRSDGEVIPTPEEHDVFRVLGLAYIEPEARS